MKNLVKKARKKDPDAFTELIQSQMQNLYKTARAILYNDEDAADAISETILCCWEKLDQLREDQYFRTWITRILVNKCRDLLRKKEALNWTNEIPEIPENDSGFINAEWKEALNGLDEKYRLVLMLYYIEGFKTSEISQILEMPESTVRTRLARGRDQLSDTYREERRKTV
ncbi:MAG TPA: sigma-70 family RNA polymerase sigma factor [Candidatus Choladousia intestinigallinarum]|nr:sigma-70 family RNA polymerase sigma factor [Candidatus Choladousia intestinigallinarum]